jgi:hypothetical protein
VDKRFRVAAGLCLALAVVLVLPTAAGATLPRAKSTLIVPSRSIAGLKLGSTPAQTKRAWGGKTCEFACGYEGPKPAGGSAPFANILLEKEGASLKVWLIAIGVGYKPGPGSATVPAFNGPLSRWKTSKGIGLGSTVGEVEAAYPKAKKETTPGGPLLTLKGPGKSATDFTTLEDRVVAITVESHPES